MIWLYLGWTGDVFIREKVSKNQKTDTSYTKHQLVRSVRHGSSVRQEIVMELGKLDIDRSQWKSRPCTGHASWRFQSMFEEDLRGAN